MAKKKPVTKITRTLCDKITTDLKKALNEVAEKHGVMLSPDCRWRFNSNQVSFPVQFTLTADAQNDAMSDARSEWDRHCVVWGLKPEHFGQEFKLYDGMFKIVGCKPSSPKNNIIIEKTKTRSGAVAKGKNKTYVCPHTEVLRALGDETVSTGDYDVVD